MDKPRPIITTRRLPFSDLSPDDFELLCLWLVKAMGYLRCEHYAGSGDEGVDIAAYDKTDSREELWYLQCKRYEKINAADLVPEVNKIQKAKNQPAGIVIATSALPSSSTRRAVIDHCSSKGYRCEIWAAQSLTFT